MPFPLKLYGFCDRLPRKPGLLQAFTRASASLVLPGLAKNTPTWQQVQSCGFQPRGPSDLQRNAFQHLRGSKLNEGQRLGRQICLNIKKPMARHLNLQVPQPCHENWNTMTAQGQGRFCHSCKKSVTDFTGMSAGELALYFNTHTEPGCGRFTQSQLEEDFNLPRRPFPGLRYLAMVAIPALLASIKTSGQAPVIRSPKETLPYRPDSHAPILPPAASATIMISGTVIGSDGNPIPFASIEILGTGGGVVADSNGRFNLSPPSMASKIRVSSAGHETVVSGLRGLENNLPIVLQRTTLEVVVVGGYIPYKYRSRKAAAKAKAIAARPEPALTIYPNPVAAGARISIATTNFESGALRIETISMSGRMMQSFQTDHKSADQPVYMATNELVPGTYIVRVVSLKNGKNISAQLVVQ
jgi:hypothetical protein